MLTTMQYIHQHKDHTGDDCLIWPYARDLKRGYGYAWLNGKTVAAHREMCRAAHGEPTFPKACAIHSCGKGHEGCVNPSHLRWATQRENIADKVIHGTVCKGRKNPNNKLTEEQVLYAYRDPRGFRPVAAELGCTWVTVRHIRIGHTWAWLTGHKTARAA